MIRKASQLLWVCILALSLAGSLAITPGGAETARLPSAPIPIEVEALVALYNATDGPNWTDHTGWLTDPDPCNWYGVLCASHTYPSYHVVWLHLANNNLTGQLPPEIVNLTQLDELLLNDNHLTGPLPAGMDNFDYIINLLLNNNQLTGPIPADLGGISISPNGRKLLRLFLHNNLLEGPIPPELGNISSLRYLDLHSNSLTGEIPESLGNLTNLWELNLSFNKLYKQIPPSLSNLTYLRKFIVSDNSLTGQIPTWFSGMPYLEELGMAYNYFTGPIPDELSAATQLQTIWLGQNQLTGNVPASLAALPNLVSLWVANNYMEGQLPIALTNLELYTFWYNNTNLCEPCDNTYLNWANTIPDIRRTWPCTPGMRDDQPYIGRGGSYFPFYGYCLKPNSTYILEVNNIFVTYFQTDSIGSFGFELRSDDPSEYVGWFRIYIYSSEDSQADPPGSPRSCSTANADGSPVASAFFRVDPAAPLLPSSGLPDMFPIPQGIGFEHAIYLPMVKRPMVLSILFGDTTTENNLSLQEGGDFDTALITAGSPPVTARRTGNGQALPSGDNNQVGDYYLQLNAADEAIAAGNPTTQVRIEVEYLDQGTDAFLIQYDALSGGPFGDGRFKDTALITKTGSGQWRTASFLISDAYFANRDHDGDFRIDDYGDGYEVIRKVTVILLDS